MVEAAVVDERLEERSKSLFGNRHMLHVGRDIASRVEAFTVKQVATKTGVPYSSVHRLVGQLEGVGLLKRAPARGPDPNHWFERDRHTFWDAVQDLCVLKAESSTRKGQIGA